MRPYIVAAILLLSNNVLAEKITGAWDCENVQSRDFQYVFRTESEYFVTFGDGRYKWNSRPHEVDGENIKWVQISPPYCYRGDCGPTSTIEISFNSITRSLKLHFFSVNEDGIRLNEWSKSLSCKLYGEL